MTSSTYEAQLDPDIVKNSVEGDARLQAQLASREAEWTDAVSYWCDYLTIIDFPGPAPDMRCAG